MAVMSALLGFTSERRWLRYVGDHLAVMFPRRIGQPGYNKRLRKAFGHPQTVGPRSASRQPDRCG